MSNPQLHFVVPCMGRLDFVKQTIDTAINQPRATYTLVDYSCPQHTGDWVRANRPAARVVDAPGRTYWYPAEARNLGAAEAGEGWLCFLDSDVMLHPEFSETVLAMAEPGKYLHAPKRPGIFGLLVCSREDFVRIGGYDEILRPYGAEDVDIKIGLGRAGVKPVELPEWLMKHIDHDDSLRTDRCAIQEKIHTELINGLYVHAKDVLLREGAAYDKAMLQTLYRFSKERFYAGYPWLSWPEPDIPSPNYRAVFRTAGRLGAAFESIEADTWGSVRAFRIARQASTPAEGDTEPVLELLTSLNSETIALRAPGHTTLRTMRLDGTETEVPITDGIAKLTLTAEPIFVFGDVQLVKDIAVTMAPAPGPAVAITLTPGTISDPIALAVSLDEEPPTQREVTLDGHPKTITVPLGAAATPALERRVSVEITASQTRRQAVRRTAIAEVPRVLQPDADASFALAATPRFTISTPDPEGFTTALAWGWTDDSLVCWIDASGLADASSSTTKHEIVRIGVDPANSKAQFAPTVEFILYESPDGPALEWAKSHLDTPARLDNAVQDLTSACGQRHLCIRLPWTLLDVAPSAGLPLGAAVRVTGPDGSRASWGGDHGDVRSPRLFNDIVLVG